MTPRELFFLLLGMFMVGTVVFWVVFYFAIRALTTAVNTLVTILTPLSDTEFLGRMGTALETMHTHMPMMLKAMFAVNKTLGVFNSALFQKEVAGMVPVEERDVLQFSFSDGKDVRRSAPVAVPTAPEPENAPEGSGGVIAPTDEEIVRNELIEQAKSAGIRVPDEKDMPEPPSA